MTGGSWIPIPESSGFGLDHLPLGMGRRGGRLRPLVAVGDHVLDLGAVADAGLLDGAGLPNGSLEQSTLNRLLAAGDDVGWALRQRLVELLSDAAVADRLADAVADRQEVRMALPVSVGDYVDCYSSLHHATNLGRRFRPGDDPLPPSWRHLPQAYHGRAGTIIATGQEVLRPRGLRMVDGRPTYLRTDALDFELEVGFVIGVGSEQGVPIDIDATDWHIAGFCLVNDWSARDIQAFEYQPLGPFLGKSFATSMSPWLTSLDALAPFKVAPPAQDPPVDDYLRPAEPWALDLHLEVLLESDGMRSTHHAPVVISRTSFADMYWTPAQQLAHVTANGASTRTGDLIASGTVSGPTPGSEGSLIELTAGGEPRIELPDGTTRGFLHDGDRVIVRGWAGDREHGPHVSLGEVTGTVVPGPASRR